MYRTLQQRQNNDVFCDNNDFGIGLLYGFSVVVLRVERYRKPKFIGSVEKEPVFLLGLFYQNFNNAKIDRKNGSRSRLPHFDYGV